LLLVKPALGRAQALVAARRQLARFLPRLLSKDFANAKVKPIVKLVSSPFGLVPSIPRCKWPGKRNPISNVKSVKKPAALSEAIQASLMSLVGVLHQFKAI
jgi:hypothetical protein